MSRLRKPVFFEIMSNITRPTHYGGEENPFEPIKVILHYKLCFPLGNVIKYVLRAGKKDDIIQDLEKAREYLDFKINDLKRERSD